MNNTPLISIIVPIYNVEDFLAECIESIIKQTYKNLDIILVNDGSTDSSVDICERYKKIDSRIVLINKQNGGLSDARNFGLKQSKGEYVAFVDSDDLVNEEFIKILYEIIKKSGTKISQCSYLSFFKNDTLKKTQISYEYSLMDNDLILKNLSRDINLSIVCNKLFDKSVLENIKFPLGRYHEDTFITPHIFIKQGSTAINESKLYYYRDRESSIVNTPNPKKFYDILFAYRDRFKLFKKHKKNNLLNDVVVLANEFIIYTKEKNNYIIKKPYDFNFILNIIFSKGVKLTSKIKALLFILPTSLAIKILYKIQR